MSEAPDGLLDRLERLREAQRDASLAQLSMATAPRRAKALTDQYHRAVADTFREGVPVRWQAFGASLSTGVVVRCARNRVLVRRTSGCGGGVWVRAWDLTIDAGDLKCAH